MRVVWKSSVHDNRSTFALIGMLANAGSKFTKCGSCNLVKHHFQSAQLITKLKVLASELTFQLSFFPIPSGKMCVHPYPCVPFCSGSPFCPGSPLIHIKINGIFALYLPSLILLLLFIYWLLLLLYCGSDLTHQD